MDQTGYLETASDVERFVAGNRMQQKRRHSADGSQCPGGAPKERRHRGTNRRGCGARAFSTGGRLTEGHSACPEVLRATWFARKGRTTFGHAGKQRPGS